MSLSPEDMRKVGGSDVAAILGLSRYAGPLSVYGRVVDGIEKDDTPQMERGRLLEPVVLDWYAARHANRIRREVRWPVGVPYLRASLDAVAWTSGRLEDWDVVVEAKTCDERRLTEWGEEGTDQIPEEYLPQVHFYMGVTGRKRADVPVLVASNFRLYRVEFDEDIYAAIRSGIKRFWRDHIEKRVPPEPTALSTDAEFIRKRFPRHKANALEFSALPLEARYLLDSHQRAVESRKAAIRAEDALEARIKMLLGEHEGVTGFADGSRLDWRQNKPSQATDWEAVAVHLSELYPQGEADLRHAINQHTKTKDGARPLMWRGGEKR